MAILLIFLLILLAYLFFLKGRTSHKGLPALRNWSYAHRGLHSLGVPENSLAAFAAARDSGYGMELDVHLMKDGNLAVIHDASLKRTAGLDISIEELTAQELENCRLEGTDERIPLLQQVLDLVGGEVPLIIELKSQKDNYGELCASVCNLLDSYNGPFCMESFDPRCVAWLRKHRSDVIRGQLTEDFLHSNVNYPWILRFAMKHQLLNLFSRPDFVAYRFTDRKTISNLICRGLWGMQGVAWTICTQEDFDTAVQENWIPVFENFKP